MIHRRPNVGEGADGARRSAEVDRSEADTHLIGSPAWQYCRDSAERWEAQAAALDAAADEPPCRHSWVAGMMHVHDEDLGAVYAARSARGEVIECERCEATYSPRTTTG